jgi:hypothetical protein
VRCHVTATNDVLDAIRQIKTRLSTDLAEIGMEDCESEFAGSTVCSFRDSPSIRAK